MYNDHENSPQGENATSGEMPKEARKQDKNSHKLGANMVKDASGHVLGVNFAVYTHPEAKEAWVCLFDKDGHEQQYKLHHTRIVETFMDNVSPCEGIIWHGFIPNVAAGQQYGYRVDGPFEPERGITFHKNRLLLDPYAREVAGYPETPEQKAQYLRSPSLFNYDIHAKAEGANDAEIYQKRFETTFKQNPIEDTAPSVPKGIVVDIEALKDKVAEKFHVDSLRGKSLFHPSDAIISEAHVGEATAKFDAIPEKYRKTYKALASDEFVGWLKTNGYTALELMPIHLDDADTHFGYMSANFFAPNPKYAVKGEGEGSPTEQFAEMVQKLRANGIETCMDVVFNHTAEGDHRGPVYSFKGLDERYYRKHDDNSNFLGVHYYDTTGTGNMMNTDHPVVREMILDSLAYYHSLGVADFRFDLMKALGRSGADHNKSRHGHRFYEELHEAIQADGRLEGVKIYGEPWDLAYKDGEDRGLPQWVSSWAGGDRQSLRLASRLPQGIDGKSLASVLAGVGNNLKYAVSHDGYTAFDSLRAEHSNGEEDIAHNYSHNQEELFRRQTFGIALEALAQGAVMRKMGSDRGHSQNLDHNPYKNEEVTRIPWSNDLTTEQKKIMDFSGQAMRFKNAHPSLRRTTQFKGPNHEYTILSAKGDPSMSWWHPSGEKMQMQHWDNGQQAFTYVLSGETGRHTKDGEEVRDTPIMAMVNGSPHSVTMKIPGQAEIHGEAVRWKIAWDSSNTNHDTLTQERQAGQEITLPPFTAVALEANKFPGKDLLNAKPVTNFTEAVVAQRSDSPATVSR